MMPKVITVFGATGRQGGGVVSPLLKAINRGDYSVRALTRNPDGAKGQDLKSKGCEVVRCDLDDKESVENAVRGSYGVYLVTNYWEHMSKDKEIEQGKRVIDVCEALGVKHLIYSGLEHVQKLIGIECDNFDGKGIVEEYLQTKQEILPFTIVRFPFYFNNLLSHSQKEQKIADNTYALNMAMEGKPINGIDVKQGGECVYGILENPSLYQGKTIGLTADKLTVQEYADILSKHLTPRKFQDSKITQDQFRALGFPGARELGNMFQFYTEGNPQHDVAETKKLNTEVQNFEEWVIANKKELEDFYSY